MVDLSICRMSSGEQRATRLCQLFNARDYHEHEEPPPTTEGARQAVPGTTPQGSTQEQCMVRVPGLTGGDHLRHFRHKEHGDFGPDGDFLRQTYLRRTTIELHGMEMNSDATRVLTGVPLCLRRVLGHPSDGGLTARFQQIDLPERVPRSVDGADQPDAHRPHKRETANGTCASPYPASSFWRCRITHINPTGGNPSARTTVVLKEALADW